MFHEEQLPPKIGGNEEQSAGHPLGSGRGGALLSKVNGRTIQVSEI